MKKSYLTLCVVAVLSSNALAADPVSPQPTAQELAEKRMAERQKFMTDQLKKARDAEAPNESPCKNAQGQVIECPKPELGATDVCKNLDGDQNRVPPGRVQDGDNCVVINQEVDVCSNIDGVQAYTPVGMENKDGVCEAPPSLDVCPNISGEQQVIPPDMEMKDGECVSTQSAVVDLCANLEGDQVVVPKGYVRDDSTQACTLIESCKPWFEMKKMVAQNGPGLYRSSKGDLYLIALMDGYKFMPYISRFWLSEENRIELQKKFEATVEPPFGVQWYAVLGNFSSKDVKSVRKDCDSIEDTQAACAAHPNGNRVFLDMYIKDRKTYNDVISMNASYAGDDKWFGHTVVWVVDKYTEAHYPEYYNNHPNYIYRRGSNEDIPFEIIGANAAIQKGYHAYHNIAYSDGVLTDDFWDFDNNFFNSDGVILTHDWNQAIMRDCDANQSNGKTTELSDVIEKVMYVKSNTESYASGRTVIVGSGSYNLDVMSRSKSTLTPLN